MPRSTWMCESGLARKQGFIREQARSYRTMTPPRGATEPLADFRAAILIAEQNSVIRTAVFLLELDFDECVFEIIHIGHVVLDAHLAEVRHAGGEFGDL